MSATERTQDTTNVHRHTQGTSDNRSIKTMDESDGHYSLKRILIRGAAQVFLTYIATFLAVSPHITIVAAIVTEVMNIPSNKISLPAAILLLYAIFVSSLIVSAIEGVIHISYICSYFSTIFANLALFAFGVKKGVAIAMLFGYSLLQSLLFLLGAEAFLLVPIA